MTSTEFEIRRLRAVLRGLRQACGMTQPQVASALEWSASKITRIEMGQVRVSVSDLRALLTVYGVKDAEKVQEYVELGRRARRPLNRWHGVLPRQYVNYVEYERCASVVRCQELTMVPALLQTPDCAYTLMRIFCPDEPEDKAKRRLQALEERQQLLEDPPEQREMIFVLDEHILHRRIGNPEITEHQLAHLLELSARPNITIQVLPFHVFRPSGSLESFTVLEFPTEEPLLFHEDVEGGVTAVEDREVVAARQKQFLGVQEATQGYPLAAFIDSPRHL